MRIATLAIAVVLLAACSDPDQAREVLRKSGYSDIQVGGWAAFWCGNGDTFTTTFTATNAHGERVSGAVCSGWAKGGTVRF